MVRSFLAVLLALVALVALFSSPSLVAADPEFISGGDSAYVPGVSAVDWGNGHIEQPFISSWGGSSSWGGRKSGGSSWTAAKKATPAKSSGGKGWGKKKRSSEVSPPAATEATTEGEQN